MIDNGNNEIRGGGVKRDVGKDEKKLIKFAWPYLKHWCYCISQMKWLLHQILNCVQNALEMPWYLCPHLFKSISRSFRTFAILFFHGKMTGVPGMSNTFTSGKLH